MTLKLSDLDPETVAREVISWVTDHMQLLAVALGPGVDVRITDQRGKSPTRVGRDSWRSTDLGLAVDSLTRYAQTGSELDADVHEYLVSLLPLWSTPDPAAEASPAPWDLRHGAPPHALALVCLAAHCRDQLSRQQPVSLRELGALAGVSDKRLRNLASKGELETRNVDGESSVRAAEARRWLSGRGIKA